MKNMCRLKCRWCLAVEPNNFDRSSSDVIEKKIFLCSFPYTAIALWTSYIHIYIVLAIIFFRLLLFSLLYFPVLLSACCANTLLFFISYSTLFIHHFLPSLSHSTLSLLSLGVSIQFIWLEKKTQLFFFPFNNFERTSFCISFNFSVILEIVVLLGEKRANGDLFKSRQFGGGLARDNNIYILSTRAAKGNFASKRCTRQNDFRNEERGRRKYADDFGVFDEWMTLNWERERGDVYSAREQVEGEMMATAIKIWMLPEEEKNGTTQCRNEGRRRRRNS